MSAARNKTIVRDRPGAGTNAGESVGQRRIQVLYGIFVLSGFSGLIYESIWTHYLKLFLGHAAYAQALVLAIFMGGMALGSGICSRYSAAWKNVLMGYALAEGLAGLLALGFHPVFEAAIRFSFENVLPAIDSKAGAGLYTWVLSALLILPQSVLLGMTFPLMSAGILRLKPRDPGRTIATLYFTNSLGAAIGVLTSGFILIRTFGLPGTVMLAGALNIMLAVAVWHLVRKVPAAGHPYGKGAAEVTAGDRMDHREPVAAPRTEVAFTQRLLLVSAAVTGAASFIYEIGWIRMLGLVLGTSTIAFELMLSTFILGLALGGLWIRRRIDEIERSGRYLALVQMIMGACALLSLVLYGYVFDVMQWLITTLERTDRGYFLFNLSSSAIAMAIMLPATFCAGMTLPLITRSLLTQGSGERSIGSVYAANTVGAIMGVVFAIHIGFPALGLQKLVTFGAVLDIGLGLVLLWYFTRDASRRPLLIAAGAALVLVIATLWLVELDTYKMASGIYRQNVLLTPENSSILYYRDGKTATVSVTQQQGKVSIRTNGKVDAAVNMTPGTPDSGDADEDTMILAGILPMTLCPEARTAAVIGFGSGLTTQTLLANPRIRRVDTIEIEENMVEAANVFRPRVELAYSDPRSTVIINDAKAFFTINNSSYDIIVSEPSNPWVSGVASLFSVEFYRTVSRHLANNGLFVQWVQLYEIDTELIISVLKAMDAVFEDYTVYAANDGDSIIVARKRGRLPEPDLHMLTMPELSYSLHRSRIYGIQDIDLRKMGTKRFFKLLLRTYSLPANSDYDPVLDQRAVRARFLGKTALELHRLSRGVFPALDMLDQPQVRTDVTRITPYARYARSQSAWIAMVLRDYLLHNRLDTRYGNLPVHMKEDADRLKQMLNGRSAALGEEERLGSLFNTMTAMISYLSPREMDAIWNRLSASPYPRAMPERERDMVSLLRSVGGRNGPEIVRAAERILESNKPVHPAVVKYTTAAGMLGALMSGDKERALRIWATHGPGLFGEGQPDLLFRLLYSESASGQ